MVKIGPQTVQMHQATDIHRCPEIYSIKLKLQLIIPFIQFSIIQPSLFLFLGQLLQIAKKTKLISLKATPIAIPSTATTRILSQTTARSPITATQLRTPAANPSIEYAETGKTASLISKAATAASLAAVSGGPADSHQLQEVLRVASSKRMILCLYFVY